MAIDFEAIVFVILSAAAIIGALGCVYARRVAHSLLSLMLTFLAVAGVMVMASACLLYTSPSPRDRTRSRMPSSA